MSFSRRRFLGWLGATGPAGLAGCTTVGDWRDGPSMEPGPDSWPSYQNDRRNSGHARTTGPTPPISEQWPPDTKVRRPGVAFPPAVVENTVYVTSAGGRTSALSAADGSQQWTFSPGKRSRHLPRGAGMPAVADGTVYNASLPMWTLYALAADDGSVQWRYDAGGPVGAPTVGAGTVYVGGADGTVYALSASDGSEQWRYDTGDAVWAAPTVVEDTVYVGTGATSENRQLNQRDPHQVVALAVSDGSERWTFETDHEVVASAAAADGTVYVGSWDEHVYALATDDGTEQWRHELNGKVDEAAPVVADGTVYVGTSRYEATDRLYALGAADGTEQWTYQARFHLQSPAVVDSTVYLGQMALG